jgi:hypothetical protein
MEMRQDRDWLDYATLVALVAAAIAAVVASQIRIQTLRPLSRSPTMLTGSPSRQVNDKRRMDLPWESGERGKPQRQSQSSTPIDDNGSSHALVMSAARRFGNVFRQADI